jgi:WD40 repeat protein
LQDGVRVISADDNTLLVWDLSKPRGEEVRVIDHGIPGADAVLITRDGQMVMTTNPFSSAPPNTVLVDADTGDHLRQLVVPQGFWGLSEDGSFAAALNPDGTYSITSMSDGSVLYTAPAGWEMDSVSWDGSMAIMHDAAFELTSRVVDTRTGATLFEMSRNGRFNRDGSLLATFGPGIYRIEHGDETGGGPDEFTIWRFFSPDGTMLAITSALPDGGPAARIYDTAPLLDGEPLPNALLREFTTHKSQAIWGPYALWLCTFCTLWLLSGCLWLFCALCAPCKCPVACGGSY